MTDLKMTPLVIEIIRKYEKSTEEIDIDKFQGELVIDKATILEHSTSGGMAAIGFRLRDIEGNIYIGQLTENLFTSLHGAFKGAKEHWLDNPID